MKRKTRKRKPKTPTKQTREKQREQASILTERQFFEKFNSIKNRTIHNLSSRILTPIEETVLALGLKFIPNLYYTPQMLHKKLNKCIQDFKRTVSLALHFKGQPNTNSLIPRIDNSPKPW